MQKTSRLFGSILFAAVVFLPAKGWSASKKEKTVTITGELDGSPRLMGNINDYATDNTLLFPQNTPIATQIYNECGHRDMCTVTAVVDANSTIVKVISVKKQ